ncbi:MAG: hypothetical protein HYZ52_01860 [Candidatus Omnitrophica bacterium]|nr:hypothetical protein [Candidatus Omnitrophota bacterium]
MAVLGEVGVLGALEKASQEVLLGDLFAMGQRRLTAEVGEGFVATACFEEDEMRMVDGGLWIVEKKI